MRCPRLRRKTLYLKALRTAKGWSIIGRVTESEWANHNKHEKRRPALKQTVQRERASERARERERERKEEKERENKRKKERK